MKRWLTIGIPALRGVKAKGFPRRAVSIAAPTGRVARTGAELWKGAVKVGVVTSGGVSPTLDKSIARAL